MKKSKEILFKHLALNDYKGSISSDRNLYTAIIDAMEEAINYTRCCKSDSEQLVCDECKRHYEKGWNDGANYVYSECVPKH